MKRLIWAVLLSTAWAELPDAPSRYPHAMFVLEASALAAAIVENGRAYTNQEHYTDSDEWRNSGKRYSLINVPIGIGIGIAGWKLEKSHRKPLRVCGHVLMLGAVGYYSGSYFSK